MAHILVGTAYNQVLRVPFSQQEEVLSFGEKRK